GDAVAQAPDGLWRRVDVTRLLLHGGGHGSRACMNNRGLTPFIHAYCWSAASSTARAIGAATSPPTPPRTTSTATATFGAPTDAICSGVASTPPWPIPATPRSSGLVSSFAAGVTLSGTGYATVGVSLKPNAFAIATSFGPPTSTARGPNTELQLTANESTSDPPQSSWWKLCSFHPFRSA